VSGTPESRLGAQPVAAETRDAVGGHTAQAEAPAKLYAALLQAALHVFAEERICGP